MFAQHLSRIFFFLMVTQNIIPVINITILLQIYFRKEIFDEFVNQTFARTYVRLCVIVSK